MAQIHERVRAKSEFGCLGNIRHRYQTRRSLASMVEGITGKHVEGITGKHVEGDHWQACGG
jgi:hypothetical protein